MTPFTAPATTAGAALDACPEPEIYTMAKTFYYKATTKDGRVAVRSSQTKAYTRAFIHADGRRANWATAGKTPPEASKRPGELVDAVEITAKEYREVLGKA